MKILIWPFIWLTIWSNLSKIFNNHFYFWSPSPLLHLQKLEHVPSVCHLPIWSRQNLNVCHDFLYLFQLIKPNLLLVKSNLTSKYLFANFLCFEQLKENIKQSAIKFCPNHISRWHYSCLLLVDKFFLWNGLKNSLYTCDF